MTAAGRLLRAAARVCRTRYPGFIFGLPLARGEMPVFTSHDVDATGFERDLQFLRDNGYRTLPLDEYLAARASGRCIRKAVLLTFDDARKSFWTTALPLLRAFDAHAALFAPDYWMSAPSQRARDDLFMSWQQLRACVRSGLVSVQSHAHRHALVATCEQLVDFANPQALTRFDVYDWPMHCIDGQDELGRPALGTPIYRSAPLLSAPRRYLESTELVRACRERVARSGGADFFREPDWRARLHELYRRRARDASGCYLSAPLFKALVASEFELSRAGFRAQLGFAPSCIAYPWMLGSIESLDLARRSGLSAAFGVALDFRAERRRAHLPLPVYGRFKCDWLRFLPGESRSSVLATVSRKLTDLAGIQHLAH